ncbi:UMP kinase, partial [Patescibacteria group bacterium]|nr:UMP kinase [Patescibacteria group bacterium]MBU1448785.1 UMP kinase [Patescibacteria group bacterium]MBU2613522.1 UMP kinase [Patescibacteria group bacterium]
MPSRPIVISLGGSMVAPKQGIDVRYLSAFRKLVLREVAKGSRFILVVGGGSTARAYQRAASAVVPLLDEDLDWLGIHATRLNAHLLRTIFREVAHPVVVKNPMRRNVWRTPVLVAAGWKPGRSTDDIAVRLAHRNGARRVINLTDIDAVYDADPRTHRDAKPLATMTWKAFRAVVGDAWVPGANAPFDPVAARLAERWGIEAVVAAGHDLVNLGRIFRGTRFRGTLIAENRAFRIEMEQPL